MKKSKASFKIKIKAEWQSHSTKKLNKDTRLAIKAWLISLLKENKSIPLYIVKTDYGDYIEDYAKLTFKMVVDK